jgi:hypothetical protein
MVQSSCRENIMETKTLEIGRRLQSPPAANSSTVASIRLFVKSNRFGARLRSLLRSVQSVPSASSVIVRRRRMLDLRWQHSSI